MADALDSKSSGGDLVRVQVPPLAFLKKPVLYAYKLKKRKYGLFYFYSPEDWEIISSSNRKTVIQGTVFEESIFLSRTLKQRKWVVYNVYNNYEHIKN